MRPESRGAHFRSTIPTDEVPFGPQEFADKIRAAANRSTGALILEPVDTPEVRAALHEAEAKGLGIVLLDSPLPATSPGKPYPVISFSGFDEAAKQLVQSAIQDAKSARLPGGGPTLVIENIHKDLYSKQRLESLISALKAADLPFESMTLDGEQKTAKEVVQDYLKNHPKVTTILADHESGVTAAFDARQEWLKTHKNTYLVGGYFACDARLMPPLKNNVQGLIDRNIEGYARKALQVALDLMDGKAVPDRALVEVRLLHSPMPLEPIRSTSDDRQNQKTEANTAKQPGP